MFEHVNGLFGRDATQDARIFELRIDGPRGEWRFGGTLREAGGSHRTGIITLDDLPVTDLLLLSGQSRLPVTTDLKLSAKADVSIDAGRIEGMKATIHTSDGKFLIEEKDFNPVTIESVQASASWDEQARVMKLDDLDYRGAGNAVPAVRRLDREPGRGRQRLDRHAGGPRRDPARGDRAQRQAGQDRDPRRAPDRARRRHRHRRSQRQRRGCSGPDHRYHRDHRATMTA